MDNETRMTAFTLRYPHSVHKKLKLRSVEEARPMTEIIIELIRKYVEVIE